MKAGAAMLMSREISFVEFFMMDLVSISLIARRMPTSSCLCKWLINRLKRESAQKPIASERPVMGKEFPVFGRKYSDHIITPPAENIFACFWEAKRKAGDFRDRNFYNRS